MGSTTAVTCPLYVDCCRFKAADINPFAQQLLEALFAAFKHPDSGENEYLMKAVMRLISFMGSGIAPVAPICLQVGGLVVH